MNLRQFKVVVRDQDGKKHKFTYRALDENEVAEKVKRIMPNVTIKTIDPQ